MKSVRAAIRSLTRRIDRVAGAMFPGRRYSAATLDLDLPVVAADPYPHYESLRRSGPVHHLTRHRAWIVLGYEEVQFGFSRHDLFSNRLYVDVDTVFLGADPPEHPAIRRIVSRYFSLEALDRASAHVEELAASLIVPELDVVRGYGLPISEGAATNLLGLDDRAVEIIRTAHRTQTRTEDYFAVFERVADRAALYQRCLSEGLAEADARSLIRLLWVAATTTTERAISRCVLRLLQHPDLRRLLERDETMIAPMIEEVLRLHPPEMLVKRIATVPVTLGGVTIPANAVVYFSIAAANRDPARFEDPGTLRIERSGPRHFSFGFGIHHCVGAALARREIAIAIRTLLTRAP
ncbi:MAG TPA: cytochrome P450, partial [Thermoanaerobaculia bacterium]|nr:cytochrome P450 [Thermoanaerobaculia bacterium]